MRIEYQIKFEKGALTITQSVEPDSSKVTTATPQVSGGLEILPAKHPGEAAAAGVAQSPDIKPAGKGGGNGELPGTGGGNGELPGTGGGNGELPGTGGGGGQGQVVVFGPVVIDVSGLMHKKDSSND